MAAYSPVRFRTTIHFKITHNPYVSPNLNLENSVARRTAAIPDAPTRTAPPTRGPVPLHHILTLTLTPSLKPSAILDALQELVQQGVHFLGTFVLRAVADACTERERE